MISEKILILESKLKMPLMVLPVKTTLVKVGGGIVMISPLPDITSFKKQVDDFGEVTDIVAPNLFHHLGIKAAHEMYPQAKMWGIEGIEQKVSGVTFNRLTENHWPYNDELEAYQIQGMPKFNEVDFYHKESKTLIVVDLCFNNVQSKGLGSWIMGHLFGTYRRFAVSRLFMLFIHNKESFKSSIGRIIDLDFKNIIIPHGVNVQGGGQARLKKALQERDLI